MDSHPFSYEDYRDFIKNFSNGEIHNTSKEIIRRFQHEQNLPSRYSPVIYLLDYVNGKYVYVAESCFDLFGYTAKQWIEEGPEKYFKKLYPSDYRVMNTRIFPENLKFLSTASLECYQNFIFSYNYRVLNAKGEYITILQRSSFLPSPIQGMPLGAIGVAFDITHFKNGTNITHTIEEAKEHDGQIYNELLYKKTYAVEGPQHKILSKREQEILILIAQGYSSKEIAKNLYLSINTVNNHRKNMLQKTDCKSSAQLLNFALKKGYL